MLSNKAIVNKRNRRLFDIVLHRNRLADGLAKKLALIGLDVTMSSSPGTTLPSLGR